MSGAYGLYSHIQSNRRRSVACIVGLLLLIYLVIFALLLGYEAMTGRASLEVYFRRAWLDMLPGIPAATIGVGIWLVIAYYFHQHLIDAVTGGTRVERQDIPRLYNLLENLCISRGITMPQLRIMETGALNAFASGMNERQYSVSVTRGLLEALDDRELEAVLAHELTHIRNGDVRLMVIATVMAGVISFFAEMLWRWFSYGPSVRMRSRDDNNGDAPKANQAMAAIIIAVVLLAVAWLLSVVLKFALSRSREYLADAGAVELTKDPDAMISALLKIAGHAEIPGAPSGIMEMCIENEHNGFTDLFATHPPIESRIDALVQTSGGRLPQAGSVPFIPPGAAYPGIAPAEGAAPGVGPWSR
jgi:heat shock protein HtpX